MGEDQQARAEAMIERAARAIAYDHFSRRTGWVGACTHAERTQWLTDQYWVQWKRAAVKTIIAIHKG